MGEMNRHYQFVKIILKSDTKKLDVKKWEKKRVIGLPPKKKAFNER